MKDICIHGTGRKDKKGLKSIIISIGLKDKKYGAVYELARKRLISEPRGVANQVLPPLFQNKILKRIYINSKKQELRHYAKN